MQTNLNHTPLRDIPPTVAEAMAARELHPFGSQPNQWNGHDVTSNGGEARWTYEDEQFHVYAFDTNGLLGWSVTISPSAPCSLLIDTFRAAIKATR